MPSSPCFEEGKARAMKPFLHLLKGALVESSLAKQLSAYPLNHLKAL